MPVLKHTIVLFGLMLLVTIVVAQPPKNSKAKEVPVQKFKPPKLNTALGAVADTAATVSVDEALQLIQLSLAITDDKKTAYTINAYQCIYKRKGVTEDEESGKTSPVTSIVAQQFKTTPLSAIWIKTISEQLKEGEEIFFYDIVVKNAQGRLMFAPNLKLTVK